MDAVAMFFGQTPVLLVAPNRPTLCHFGDLIFSGRVGFDQIAGGIAERANLAPNRDFDGVKFAKLHTFGVHLDYGLAALDPGVVRERGAKADH